MRIVIDKSRCTGHARCNWIAPDLVALDYEGSAVPPDGPVPAGRADGAFAVRDNCPENAISLSETEEEI